MGARGRHASGVEIREMTVAEPARETRVKLVVYAFEESPDAVTAILGVTPTKTWLAGDPVLQQAVHKQKENGWMLRSPTDPASGDADASVLELIRLFPDTDAFNKLPGAAQVQVTCTLYGYSQRPSMYLSTSAMKALARIGADLDVDVYDLSSIENGHSAESSQ
jgi:Domain of unknown function (DUF4279)